MPDPQEQHGHAQTEQGKDQGLVADHGADFGRRDPSQGTGGGYRDGAAKGIQAGPVDLDNCKHDKG